MTPALEIVAKAFAAGFAAYAVMWTIGWLCARWYDRRDRT